MKTAMVLSGGGAKGAYQMGVWKALRKLHIKYQIITGTSVGALNGALMVQNNYYLAKRIWENITYNDVYGRDFPHKENCKDIDIYKQYVDAFFADGGMDMTALENLFGKYMSKFRFKLSRIDYGMITVNLDTLKPISLTKKDLLKKDEFKEYILASAACFPAIKAKTIDDKKYVDGGYYDNLPINLAISMGAERIIAVDLKAPGVKKQINNKNVEVIRIYPKNKIVSFLVFDSDLSKKAIQFGYNDTMKAFNKLDGNKFTFNKGNLYSNYDKYKEKITLFVSRLASNNSLIFDAISLFNDVNSILNYKDFYKLHNDIIEYLGRTFNFDESKIYNINEFNNELITKFNELGKVSIMSQKTMLNSRLIIAYIYNIINSKKLDINKICKIMTMFKKEFMAAIYLTIIKNN